MSATDDAALHLLILRKHKGITQHELAKKSGISRSVIAKIETGKLSPRIDQLDRVYTALGYTLILGYKKAD